MHLDGLVQQVRKAQTEWKKQPLSARRDVLLGLHKTLKKNYHQLAEIITHENGKPLRQAQGEVEACFYKFETKLNEMVEALAPHPTYPGSRSTLVYEPLGVAGLITPWNFPLLIPHEYVVSALMAGNGVILKPSELTPRIADAYVEILRSLLPADLIQVVHGAGDAGAALVRAPVDLVCFTGSRDVGREILASATPDFKRVILELGGKDPLFVLRSADIEAAASFAAQNSFRNTGQVCVSSERLFIENVVLQPFLEKFIAKTRQHVVGSGFAEDTTLGPLINAKQKARVMSLVEDALAKGAKVLHGELVAPENYMFPLVLAEIRPDMRVWREEIFGPVALVFSSDDVNEMITIANDTPYGLGATVFGESQAAEEVASQITSGMVSINRDLSEPFYAPWVGAKQSGYGFHGSAAGHRQFCQTKLILRQN